MIRSGKEIRKHSINGTGEWFLENCITIIKPCLIYMEPAS